jgi:AcrR family transcriptional regulator
MKRHPEHMIISELSTHAGISAATIWYYSRMGLLPRPIKYSRSTAYYTDVHLKRLEQICSLKQKGLSLAAISEIVKEDVHTSHDDAVYESKRDIIMQAAVGLFREKGYNSTTIRDIAVRAGVGKITFYHYFKDKRELFIESADHVFYDIGKDDPSIRDEQDGLKRLWNRGYSFFHNNLHMIDMLNLARGFSATRESQFKQMLEKIMQNLINPIQVDLLMASEQGQIHFKDIPLLAHFFMGGVEYCTYYIQNLPDISLEDLLAKILDMTLHGISSDRDLEVTGRKKTGKSLIKRSELSKKSGITMINKSIMQEATLPKASMTSSNIPSSKREDVLSAATELFLKKGYADMSVSELAHYAHMSKETIYQNFRSKEELFMVCADRIFHGLYDTIWTEIKGEKDMAQRLSRRVKAFFSSFSRWINMMNLLRSLSIGDNPSFKEKFQQLVKQLVNPMIHEIEHLKQEGRVRKEVDGTLAAYILMGVSEYGAQYSVQEGLSADNMLSYIDFILEKGIGHA